MPYVIKKVANKPCYTVTNLITGAVHAKCTTKAKAESQKNLLLRLEKK
jgi:hypothetical protein